MNRAESPETIIIRRFVRGDDTAFSELYERHNQRLFNYCAKILKDHPAAEDIAHSVWERVIDMRGDLEGISNPLGFIYRSARNLCFDHLKHGRFRAPLESAGELPSSGEKGLSLEEELVVAALERLPEETKEIFILHYYSGYPFEEIAPILGKKTNAIWTKVSRARKQIKEIVENELSKVRSIQ
jgi:RNA polymerase sigma-70 factor (ECF subfamily)